MGQNQESLYRYILRDDPSNGTDRELTLNCLSSGKSPTLARHKEEPFKLVIDTGKVGFQVGNPISASSTKIE